MQPTSADLDGIASEVASRLGGDADPAAVRALLSAWWQWAGVVAQRGGVMDSEAFLNQREAEDLLELPRPVAERAIEIEIAYLHGIGGARRAPQPLPGRKRRREPGDESHVSPMLVGIVAFGALGILVAGGLLLGSVVEHIPLPGGERKAATAPYRAWIGILAGFGGLLATFVAARRGPHVARALRIPQVGLLGLGLFSVGLLGGAQWLEYSAGGLFVLAGAAAWLSQKL
jgi:hypothetical protein